MRTSEIIKSLGIVMQIGQVIP